MKFVKRDPSKTVKSEDPAPQDDPLTSQLKELVNALNQPKTDSPELLAVARGIHQALTRLADAASQKAYQFDVKTGKSGRIEKVIATRLS